MENNEYILESIKSSVYMTGEQLEADKLLTWNEVGSYVNSLLINVEKRLEVGAKKYGEQVPIFRFDSETRNNLKEAIEEQLDCLVYSTAVKISVSELKELDEKTDFDTNTYTSDYLMYIKRSIVYLLYSYFLLKKAEDTKAKIKIQNKPSKEEQNG